MSKIHTLDEHLTNMIAAGEVVEKPMGVVKELVENSIDAKANHIIVKVTNGGRDRIEVIDNGEGMDQQDAVRAFNRHATSKIANTADLWNISTMGFRGEALPSIASVSRVSLLTSNGIDSTAVQIEYGKIIKAEPAASSIGTTIAVEGLFHKTPARLKHLKSPNTELNSIIDLMQKFALSHPEIAFELYSDDKERFSTAGNGDLQEAVMAVYGLEAARNSIKAEFSDYDFHVNGILVLPSINRSTRQYINCFINGRIVHSYGIQKAVIDAYREFMMPDRYPVCILNIEADTQLVDVNVHPSKWEIRLSKEKQLYDLIQKNVSEALRTQFRPAQINVRHEKTPYEEKKLFESSYAPKAVLREEYVREENNEPAEVVMERFRYLAQLHGNYILACDEENLYIVDQHAAMERCRYEEICREIENNSIECQQLLVPIVVELTPAEREQLDKLNEVFSTIGITLEPFSGNSVVVREVPLWLINNNEENFIKDLIGEIITDSKMSRLDIRKDRIATMACHSSIRFNRYLDVQESRRLLSRLGQCLNPFNCPHGRPTMMVITAQQLEKEFKRVL